MLELNDFIWLTDDKGNEYPAKVIDITNMYVILEPEDLPFVDANMKQPLIAIKLSDADNLLAWVKADSDEEER